MVNVNTNFEQAVDDARQVIPESNIVICQRILESPAVFPMFTNDLLGDPILIAPTFREG